jgi:ankyrin repeat protein
LQLSKLLIENNIDVNDFNNHYRTPLHYACIYSFYDICQLLIDHGADINKVDREGISSLVYAIISYSQSHTYNICELLIKHGAKIEYLKYNPLHKAAYNEDISVCKLLLDNGANINFINYDYQTPLSYICSSHYDKVKICKFLIDNGAYVSNSRNQIHLAAKKNNKKICNLLDLEIQKSETYKRRKFILSSML